MTETVYLNGELLPREDARISPFDHGFLYGYGLFETVRAYPGMAHKRLFRLDRHLARLRTSARMLGIEVLPPEAKLAQAAYSVLEANGLQDARLRITVSLGPGEITPDAPARAEPTVFIAARPFVPPSPQTLDEGYAAVVFPHRVGTQTLLAEHKTCSYLHYLLARRHAHTAGVQEALLVSEDGLLLEASASNLFLVSSGNLMTAPVSAGVLPGITRETVLEMANALGMPTQEVAVPVEAISMVDEAFLTSSLVGVMPLSRVVGQTLGAGAAGPISRRLMRAYDLLVKREIGVL